MKMKKQTAFVCLCITLLMMFPVWNSMQMMQFTATHAVSDGDVRRWMAAYDAVEPEDVRQRIDGVRDAYEEQMRRENVKKSVEDSIAAIERGDMTYREVFRDVYLCGDSLMAVVYSYDLMNENHIMAKVSAHLSDLEEMIPRIVKAKPRVLILHYGINSLSDKEGHAKKFVKDYRALIRQIKEGSPKTRIIVSLLFPVDTSVAKGKQFQYIGRYNQYLTEMCEEEGVEYLDSTELLHTYNQYYKEDGIHLNRGFYVKHWFKHIMREMEIY